jgi:hypothetical protein
MIMALAIGGLMASLAVPLSSAPAATQTPPPPGQVTIEAVTVNGSSCRPGTAVAVISPDREAFTVLYSEYLAQVGDGAPPAESHQKCKLNVEIRFPQGYTYAIVQADYRGYALLQPGASAVQRAVYKFQGDPPKVATEHAFTGPYDDYWLSTDVTPADSLVYAPCGKVRKINIDTELQVDAGTSAPGTGSFVAMDSTDGSISATYRLAWRTC